MNFKNFKSWRLECILPVVYIINIIHNIWGSSWAELSYYMYMVLGNMTLWYSILKHSSCWYQLWYFFDIHCQSNNCIYAIEYTRCGQHYVGQTSRHVGRRMYEHRTSILEENMDLSVGEHFSKKNNHDGWKDFKFFILEFCSTPADESHTKDREAIERKWQYQLRCNYPGGMNREDALVKY